MENRNIELFICDCHSTDHQIIIMQDTEEDEKTGRIFNMCYMHIHLSPHELWGRIVYGIKYIFGYKSRYGAFDEFIFNPEDADRLQNLVNYLRTQAVTENRDKPSLPLI